MTLEQKKQYFKDKFNVTFSTSGQTENCEIQPSFFDAQLCAKYISEDVLKKCGVDKLTLWKIDFF